MKEIEYPHIKSVIKIDETGKIKFHIQKAKENFLNKIDNITNLKFTNIFLKENFSFIIQELLEVKNNKDIESRNNKLDFFIINIQLLISDFLLKNIGINGLRFSKDFTKYLSTELLNSQNIIETFNNIFLNDFLYFVDKANFGQTPYINPLESDIEKFNDYGYIQAYLDNKKLKLKFIYDDSDNKIRESSFKNSLINKESREYFLFIKLEIYDFITYIIKNENLIFYDAITEFGISINLIQEFIFENKDIFRNNKKLNQFRLFFQYITLNKYLTIFDFNKDIEETKKILKNAFEELDKFETKFYN